MTHIKIKSNTFAFSTKLAWDNHMTLAAESYPKTEVNTGELSKKEASEKWLWTQG